MMGSLFSKPKSTPMPPPPPPAAIPEVGEEAGDFAMKLARKRAGFRKTTLVGGLEPLAKGKKRLLGG